MPSIRLRSTQNALRSACDHPTDHPSIRLLSVAITLLLCPRTPGASQAPLSALEAERCHDPEERKGGRKLLKPYNHVTRGRPGLQARRARIPPRSLAERRPARPLADRNVLANGYGSTEFAHTVPTRQLIGGSNAVISAIFDARPCDGKSHEKGFRARTASTPFTLIVGAGASATCQPGQRRNLNFRRNVGVDGQKTRQGVGVGGKTAARPIIDLSPSFRGPSPKTCCCPATKTGALIFWERLEKSGGGHD
jgi:hypothetical protein